MKIDFEEGTATFWIKETGSIKGETYVGMFKVKCILNPIEFIEADGLYRQLLGSDSPTLASNHAGNLAYALAQLRYRVIKAPPFWDDGTQKVPGGQVDDNILLYVFSQCSEAETTYREKIQDQVKQATKSVRDAIDSGKVSPESLPEDDVDKEQKEIIEDGLGDE